MVNINSTDLTDDEVTAVEAAMIETQHENLVGRKIFGTKTVDAGTMAWKVNTKTNMSAAEEVAEGAEFPNDKISRTPSYIHIQKLGKGYELTRESILAARRNGYEIDTENATDAALQVAELEDYNIFNTIQAGVGQTFVTANTWDGSSDTVQEDVLDMRVKLRDYNFKFDNLILDVAAYKYVMLENTYGIAPITQIEKLGVTVTESAFLPATYDGIACDSRQARLIVAEDMASEGEYVLQNQSYKNQVFERVVTEVRQANAFVGFTATQA
jgi:uncharacterized linocin/CFP29 family protein